MSLKHVAFKVLKPADIDHTSVHSLLGKGALDAVTEVKELARFKGTTELVNLFLR